jgi:hypothetical protein
MPSYGGVNIFGLAVTMRTADNPRERQINSFFGIGGLETLDGGFRGRVTDVTGILVGNSAAALASAEALFRSYNDGVARTLVDNSGTGWLSVRLESFQPVGRVKQSIYGYYFRPYRARFLHLM